MPDIRTRLFGPALLTNAAATVFTSPSNTTTIIKHLRVSNPSGSPVNFTMSIGADAAGTRVYGAVTVPAGGAIEAFCMYVVNEAEIVQAFGSSNNVLVLTLDGVENVLG
jgi:hypothetical protein